MRRKRSSESERERQVVAQEAARVIVDHGVGQAPMSPIDGKPMKCVDADAVQELLQHV